MRDFLSLTAATVVAAPLVCCGWARRLRDTAHALAETALCWSRSCGNNRAHRGLLCRGVDSCWRHGHREDRAGSDDTSSAHADEWHQRRLFLDDPSALNEAQISAAARAAGVDMSQFVPCTKGGRSDQVAQDVELGKQLGVTGTPAFFVGFLLPSGSLQVSETISGAMETDQFRRAIDGAIRGPTVGWRIRNFLGL